MTDICVSQLSCERFNAKKLIKEKTIKSEQMNLRPMLPLDAVENREELDRELYFSVYFSIDVKNNQENYMLKTAHNV